MRLLFLFFLLVILGIPLVGQNIPSTIVLDGYGGPNRTQQYANVDTLSSGFFVQLFDRTSLNGLNEDVFLYKYDPVTLSVVDSLYLGDEVDQTAGALCSANDGHIYVAASTINLEDENQSDLVIYKIDADFNLLETFSYNFKRYELSFHLAQVGAGRLGLITMSRDEFSADNTSDLITVSMEDGGVVSVVELVSFIPSDNCFISSDGEDRVLIGRSNSAFAGLELMGVNVITGEQEFYVENIPSINCGISNQELLTSNSFYSEVRNAHVIASLCGNILEVTSDGSISIETLDEPIIGGVSNNAWVQQNDTGLTIYGFISSHEVIISESGYALGESTDYNTSTSVPASPLINNSYLSNGHAGYPRLVTINETGAFESSIAGFNYVNSGVFTTNSHINFSSNSGLIAAAHRRSGKYSAFFYDFNGSLIDSTLLSNENRLSTSNFVVLPNGNFATLLTDANAPPTQYLISFNKDEGINDTILSLQYPVDLYGGDTKIEQLNSGDFIIRQRNTINFNFRQQVLRIEESGNVVYDVLLSPVINTFTISPVAIDAEENFYQAASSGIEYMLLSLDGSGEERYNIPLSLSTETISVVNSLEMSQDNERLLIAGETRDTQNLNFSFVAEIDASSGVLIWERILNAEESYVQSTVADYQPDSENIVVFCTRFRGDDVPVPEQNGLQISILNQEAGIIFQRDLAVGYYGIPSLKDIMVTDDFKIFASGQAFPNELNSSRSVLLVADFDEVVSVEEVSEIAEISKLKVFPNPTADLTTISWDQAKTGPYELELISPQGRRISRWRGELTPGRASLSLDLSQRPAGTYLLRLTTDDGVSTQRVVKQ